MLGCKVQNAKLGWKIFFEAQIKQCEWIWNRIIFKLPKQVQSGYNQSFPLPGWGAHFFTTR